MIENLDINTEYPVCSVLKRHAQHWRRSECGPLFYGEDIPIAASADCVAGSLPFYLLGNLESNPELPLKIDRDPTMEKMVLSDLFNWFGGSYK
jgi:hypothetical protein